MIKVTYNIKIIRDTGDRSEHHITNSAYKEAQRRAKTTGKRHRLVDGSNRILILLMSNFAQNGNSAFIVLNNIL